MGGVVGPRGVGGVSEGVTLMWMEARISLCIPIGAEREVYRLMGLLAVELNHGITRLDPMHLYQKIAI